MAGLEYNFSNGQIDIDTSAAVITKQVENLPSVLYPLRIADLAPYDHISLEQYLLPRMEVKWKIKNKYKIIFRKL